MGSLPRLFPILKESVRKRKLTACTSNGRNVCRKLLLTDVDDPSEIPGQEKKSIAGQMGGGKKRKRITVKPIRSSHRSGRVGLL